MVHLGWSYIFNPTLDIYRMPYPDLIRILRTALRRIWERGMIMEERWAAKALADREKAKAAREQKTARSKEAFGLVSDKDIFPGIGSGLKDVSLNRVCYLVFLVGIEALFLGFSPCPRKPSQIPCFRGQREYPDATRCHPRAQSPTKGSSNFWAAKSQCTSRN